MLWKNCRKHHGERMGQHSNAEGLRLWNLVSGTISIIISILFLLYLGSLHLVESMIGLSTGRTWFVLLGLIILFAGILSAANRNRDLLQELAGSTFYLTGTALCLMRLLQTGFHSPMSYVLGWLTICSAATLAAVLRQVAGAGPRTSARTTENSRTFFIRIVK